jgi:hypothetical protein
MLNDAVGHVDIEGMYLKINKGRGNLGNKENMNESMEMELEKNYVNNITSEVNET